MGYTIIRALLDFFFFHIFRLQVEGKDNIPLRGAVIIAANHKSYFDPPLAGVAFHNRRLSYMAKSELFRNPLFGWLIRKLGAFPVKRNSADMGAIRQSVRIIKGGEALLIFPEGGHYPWQATVPVSSRHGLSCHTDRHAGDSSGHYRFGTSSPKEREAGGAHREAGGGQEGKAR